MNIKWTSGLVIRYMWADFKKLHCMSIWVKSSSLLPVLTTDVCVGNTQQRCEANTLASCLPQQKVYSGSEMVVNSSTVQLYSINVYSGLPVCLLLHYATTPIAVILYQGRESARSKIIPAAKSPHETSVAFEWLTGHHPGINRPDGPK